jgi:hypothetical protein
MRDSFGEVAEFAAEDRYSQMLQIATAPEPHFQRLGRIFDGWN